MAQLVILEDDYTLLDLYQDVMERAGYSVFPASSLMELQTYFQDNSADLIIADLRLGASSPVDTIQELRKIQDQTQVAVILISAQMMIYEDVCRSAGFTNLLTKPFPNTVLIQLARRVLEEHQSV